MGQVTDIKQVKADLVGQYAVRLSVVTTSLEVYAEFMCKTGRAMRQEGHTGNFADCPQKDCAEVRHLIENTRQMISQGV